MTHEELKAMVTEDWCISLAVAEAVNQWLHQQGTNALDYCHFVNRVCDLKEVIEPALEQGRKRYFNVKERLNADC